MNKRLSILSIVAIAAGCSRAHAVPGDNEMVCTMDARAGITVTVIDSAARQPPSVRALVVAHAVNYADTARVPLAREANRYSLVFERPGTYDVTVNAAGYRPWLARDVTVSKETCHVQNVELTAQLQR